VDVPSLQQNRQLAWDVLRARLSEKRRADEQERRNANRLTAIKGSNRGDKIRTYNAPQDRMTDHRIGYSANGLGEILNGEGFVSVVEAMKQDFAARRIEALLQGEEDLME
jgi:peptide chain release factor 1